MIAMKKMFFQFVHAASSIFGLRHVLLLSGIALLAACSGKSTESESKNIDNDSLKVKCYDPMPIPDSTRHDSTIGSEKIQV